MKKAILRISIILSCLFTACFAGFSIAMTTSVTSEQHVSAIAKPLNDSVGSQQSQILQTPQVNNTWAKKLKADVATFVNPTQKEQITTPFTIDQINSHSTVSNFSIAVSGQVAWDEKASFSSSWKTGDTTIDSVSLSLGGNVTAITRQNNVGTNANYDGYRVNWSSHVYRENNWSTTFNVSIPNTYAIDDFLNSISITANAHANGNGDTWTVRLKSYFVTANGQSVGSWTGNEETHMGSGSSGSITKSGTLTQSYIGQAHYYTSNQQLFADPIYISADQINNHQFTDDELKGLVKIYDNIGKNYTTINYTSIALDRTNKKIDIVAAIPIDAQKTYGTATFSLPLHIVNLDKLIYVSETSSSVWNHLPTGETRFWDSKPTTKITLSEDYLQALYYGSHKADLLKQVDTDAWGFVAGDKALATAAIESYALNSSNYEQVLQAYQNSHDQKVLTSLKPSSKIQEIIKANGFENVQYLDYLYAFKNCKLNITSGADQKQTQTFAITDINDQGNLSLLDAEVRQADAYKTSWQFSVSGVTLSGLNTVASSPLKLDLSSDDLKTLYDVDLKYADASQTSAVHSYLFQAKGIDIASNISFVMEDGTLLDENFIIKHSPSTSSLQVGQPAYVAIRYWATLAGGQQEYVTLTKQGTDWMATKFNKKISDLDASFDESKIEYLFNQNLQFIVNPYQATPGTPITASTPQSFGISKIIDESDGNTKVLEDWNDGFWSHSSTVNGNAVFDGVFGADTNGIFDQNGHLTSGKHKLSITLKNQSISGFKTSFNICIDKDPIKIETKPTTGKVDKLVLKDDVNDWKDLYFSNGPIHFTTQDVDLASVSAQLLDADGNWYDLPVTIKSMQINNKWTQVVDSTVDYAGFARVTILDQAANAKTVYFWLAKQNEAIPGIAFDKSLLLDDNERSLGGSDLFAFTSSPKVIVTNPLISDLTVTPLIYKNGNWIDSKDPSSFAITDYKFVPGTDYQYGKTINSQQASLEYAGDELKPFLVAKANEPAWKIIGKQVDFTKPGMYKFDLKTRFDKNQLIEEYVYIKDDSMEVIDKTLITHDQSNFDNLPSKDEGPKDKIDKQVDSLKKISLTIPDLLIKDISIKYSLPWYTDFTELKYDESLDLSKEGKYIVEVTDIFNKKYELKVLVLDKDVKTADRVSKGLIPIYADESKIDTAFWQGQVIWNYYRYEDADHAKWEHDNFISNAIKNGLTKDQAEALYQHMKLDSSWDGALDAKGNSSNFDFKEHYGDMTKGDHDPNFNKIESLSKAQIGGIIAGSVIGGLGIASGVTWLSIIRFRRKAIR